MNKIFLPLSVALLLGSHGIQGQTIAEKQSQDSAKKNQQEGADSLLYGINQKLLSLRSELVSCYAQVAFLKEKNASSEEYESLLQQVNNIKRSIQSVENEWRESVVNDSKKEEEGYALWDQEDTTLGQLVMEYGALDYLYIVPPDMTSLKQIFQSPESPGQTCLKSF
jgi:general secretion pathway protein D